MSDDIETTGLEFSTRNEATEAEDRGRVVHLKDPNREKMFDGDVPVTVRIAGRLSRRFRQVQDGQARRMIKKNLRDMTPEELSANREELVAGCILETDWNGFRDHGQIVGYSRERAKMLAATPWIREQLEEAQGDHSGFSSAASASSSAT